MYPMDRSSTFRRVWGRYRAPGANQHAPLGPLLDVQYQRTKEKVDELLNQLEGMCGLTFVSDGHCDKSRQPIVNFLCCAP